MNRRLSMISLMTLPLSMALSACSSEQMESQEDEAGAATELEESTDDYGVNAGDFDKLALTSRVEGPSGTEVQSSFVEMTDGAGDAQPVSVGDMEAWVACDDTVSACDPASLPKGTVYTYVYRVTPGVDEENDKKFPRPDKVVDSDGMTRFSIVLPAKGYAGNAGYSLSQAREALGSQGTFSVTCNEGMLSWEVASGERWGTGEPITFYWQSSEPPLGAMDAFILEGQPVGDDDGAKTFKAVAAGPHPTTRNENDKSGCT